jgi:hypothetical protein
MFIPDLEEVSSDRRLQAMRDGEFGSLSLAPGTFVRAVGWLGSSVLSPGETRDACIERLMDAYEKYVLIDGTRGWHDCEICEKEGLPHTMELIKPTVHWHGRELKVYGHGEYLVRHRDVVYVAPALLLHYIIEHRYKPPEEFQDAVIFGSFLGLKDLPLFRPSR